MRIEMCGPPTAGKSRLVKELCKRGYEHGPKGNVDKIPDAWRKFADFTIATYAETQLKSLPDKTLRSLAAAWKGSQSKKVVVFDELVILCGFSMAIRLPKDKTKYYFEHVPLPELLVYLTAPLDVLTERNESRGDGSRVDKTKRCIKAHETYIPFLARRRCRIIQLDSSKLDTPQLASAVIRRVNIMKGKEADAKSKRKK